MNQSECCPPFNPEPWDGKEITFSDRLCVKDRVRSFFHVPLNFGTVIKRNVALIEKAGAIWENRLVLSDENSLWGADVYLPVDKEVADAQLARLNCTFLCRVFEGPYSKIGKWIKKLMADLKSKGKEAKRLLFYYTTCPKCAKKYGKNYVVIMAEV